LTSTRSKGIFTTSEYSWEYARNTSLQSPFSLLLRIPQERACGHVRMQWECARARGRGGRPCHTRILTGKIATALRLKGRPVERVGADVNRVGILDTGGTVKPRKLRENKGGGDASVVV
jgi:hypothetical protein